MDLFGAGAATQGTLQMVGALGSAYMSAKYAKEMQRRQIEWERERATHAHQWEVQDLQAAGLNPILSAGGNGATTGGISAPVPDMSGYAQAGEAAGQAIWSAISAKQKQKEIDNQTELAGAEIKQKDFQNQLLEMQSLTEAYRQGLINKETAATAMETNLKEAQLRAVEQDIQQKAQRFESELEELKARAEEERNEGRKKAAEATMQEYQAKYKRLVFWQNQITDAMRAVGQFKRDFFGTKTTTESHNTTEMYDSKGRSRGRKESHSMSAINKLTLGLTAARLISVL